MNTTITLLLFLNFGLSLLVGFIGMKRKIGFFMAFWVSFFFTPIIGIIVTFLYKYERKDNKDSISQNPG